MQGHRLRIVLIAKKNILSKIPEGLVNEPQHELDILLYDGMRILLLILAPITPHICDYLWQNLGYGDKIIDARWPDVDENALIVDEIQLIVQINGKLRGKITVSANANEEACRASAELAVAAHLENKTIKRCIVVPKRLVNIVIQ